MENAKILNQYINQNIDNLAPDNYHFTKEEKKAISQTLGFKVFLFNELKDKVIEKLHSTIRFKILSFLFGYEFVKKEVLELTNKKIEKLYNQYLGK